MRQTHKHKHKHLIRNLACEAESVIALIPPCEQEHVRYQVAQDIKIVIRYTLLSTKNLRESINT